MAKTIHCAQCAEELKAYPKVIQNPQRVVYLIDPHECKSYSDLDIVVIEPLTGPNSPLQSAFDALLPKKTVKKSNGLDGELKLSDAGGALNNPLIFEESGDKRDKDHLRKEKTSSAPAGVLAQMKHNAPSAPEGDITVEPEGGD